MIAAAPAYLATHGTPRTPDDLASHNCLTLPGVAGQGEWPFRGADGAHAVGVRGSLTANNAETLYELALQGLGLIRLSDLIVGAAIRSGGLVPVLTDVHQPEPLPVHAVYLPARHRPPKVGALVDFLVEKFASSPWRLPHPLERATPRARRVRRRRK